MTSANADGFPSEGDGRLEKVADLVGIAGALRPLTAVVAGGERVEDLLLVEAARDHGIIDRIILIGRKERIAAAVAEVGIEVPSKDIIGAENEEESAAATVAQINSGVAEMVLKGSVPTHVLHRHMLPLAVRTTVSLVSIFDAAPIAQGRPMIVTDAGVTTVCNFGRIAGLIRNAVDVARAVMRIDRPRVALLAANEKELPTLPSTQIGAAFARRGWPDADIYGPLQLDLATDPGAVAVKGLPDTPGAHAVGGRADILVCPNIDAANAVYKMISALIKYGDASMANITMGFPKPYVLLSRSDALETRLNSLALGAIYAQRFTEKPRTAFVPTPTTAKRHRVLVVNPGSTSTKIAVFENDRCVYSREREYAAPPAANAAERRAQAQGLFQRVLEELRHADCGSIDAIAARGGFLPRLHGKIQSGAYVIAENIEGNIVIDEALVAALLESPEREHASNLGIPVAAALARELKAPAYTVDPVVVDEFAPEAEISGYKGIVRQSISHALSVRATARRAAQTIGRPIEDITLVVAHLGGGITVAAMRNGRMTDSSIALLGGGPFTPRRTGQLPTGPLIDLCYSGRFTKEELVRELTRQGGLQSYLGEHRLPEIEQRIRDGDDHARLIMNAMIYQISKEIGAMFAAVECEADAIVLTGGMARSDYVRSELRRRLNRLAPVLVFEESIEMEALASEVIRILNREATPHRYTNE